MSCNPKATHSLQNTASTTQLTSVHHDTVITHDTIFRFKGDTSKITAQVVTDKNGCVDMPEIVTESPRSKMSVSITKGKMKADCICKDLEIKCQLQEKRITELLSVSQQSSHTSDVKEIKEVRFVPKWIKALAWTGAGCILAAIIWLVYKAVRLYLKLTTHI